MTCKDCLHFDVCKMYCTQEAVEIKANLDGAESFCNGFADESRFIELPCKVGYAFYGIDDFDDESTIVVSVVRCKNCKYWDDETKFPICHYWENNTNYNDFCSRGECIDKSAV